VEHPPIKLIVGLGNPGTSHKLDRHNVGFWFVDALAQRAGGNFRAEHKFQGEACRVGLEGHELRLLKPTTYMNRSGMSVQALSSYLHIQPEQILVVHDDLDLPAGTVRLKRGGGAGGHNGVRDVITHLGPDFFRLRVGVGHPGQSEDVIDHVLERANREDENKIIEAIGDALDVLPILLGQGEQKAMHKLHSRGVVPRPHKKERGAESGETADDDEKADDDATRSGTAPRGRTSRGGTAVDGPGDNPATGKPSRGAPKSED
jgi:PTH1 family peptidyl-tRNA hydrolase